MPHPCNSSLGNLYCVVGSFGPQRVQSGKAIGTLLSCKLWLILGHSGSLCPETSRKEAIILAGIINSNHHEVAMLLPHRRSGEKYVWHWVILVGKYIATSLPNSRDKWKRPASTVWEVYGYWGWCRASQTKQTSKTNHCSCLSLGEPIMHGWEEAEHQMEPPDQPELSFPFCASFKKKRSSGTPVSLLPRFLGGS